jgi:hypothetical protein
MELGLSFLGVVVGITGVIVAAFQNSQKKKLEQILLSRSWYNFFRADNSYNTAQLSLASYKELHAPNISPQVLELLARGDGLGLEIVSDAVQAIQMSERSFTRIDIERWKAEDKISERSAILFQKFCLSSDRENANLSRR